MTNSARTILMRVLASLLLGTLVICVVDETPAMAGREVSFPPPDSKPPPPVKSPPRTQTSGEDTGIIPDYGPTMRKTQERRPPPPTTLTVMYKVKYGESLSYTFPDGRKQTFEQWESFKSDGYNLTRYVNDRLADGNNYVYATQPLSSPGFDPVDIPILYMTGDYDFALSEAEVANLRRFLLDGGTIIFNAARGLDEYNAAVAREMRKVFPQKRFMRVPLDHSIFNGRYRIHDVTTMINGVKTQQAPEIYSIDIGTRAAAIIIPGGMGAAWSGEEYHPAGKHIIGESAIRLGVNIVSYVLGNTEYGRFLAQQFPVYNGATQPGDVLKYAEARYAGAWGVNPALQNSVMRGIHDNTGIQVDYTPNYVDLDDEQIGSYPLVMMTGHYDFAWTSEEVANMRNYLMRGGTLFATAAAGLKPFDVGFRREIKRIFPDSDLVRIPPSHPMFAGGWNPIQTVQYTPSALSDDPLLQYPEFYAVFVDQRPVVIYTPYDVFSGLNRESNAYAKGLTSDDALRVAISITTYVMSH